MCQNSGRFDSYNDRPNTRNYHTIMDNQVNTDYKSF
jgi:hypothetical protein